jgi:hypothetical protein
VVKGTSVGGGESGRSAGGFVVVVVVVVVVTDTAVLDVVERCAAAGPGGSPAPRAAPTVQAVAATAMTASKSTMRAVVARVDVESQAPIRRQPTKTSLKTPPDDLLTRAKLRHGAANANALRTSTATPVRTDSSSTKNEGL